MINKIMSASFLDNYIICAQFANGITKKYDCIGHHEHELTEDNVNDVMISLNPENIKLIHFKCHNKVHERWSGFFPYLPG